ncbi:hypothetical protein [Spongiactinospora rosea]|uniref:hypothetical protein n=1 Tax=Spongiactinospora rosea TaxID=2248750 RepID=UPI001CEC967F|nr:hypothetical protein [Spongiactinospora rosea]
MAGVIDHPLWITLELPLSLAGFGLRTTILFMLPLVSHTLARPIIRPAGHSTRVGTYLSPPINQLSPPEADKSGISPHAMTRGNPP